MKKLIRKIIKENLGSKKEQEILLKIMISIKIDPIFYLSIQDWLIDDAGYSWDDLDNIIEAHREYFKLVYGYEFTPYNFLTAYFSHLEPRTFPELDGHYKYYGKYNYLYIKISYDENIVHFDYENIWNRLHEFFGLGHTEIKNITKEWVSNELNLKNFDTYYYN